MSIRQRVKKLEARRRGHDCHVFFCRSIVRPTGHGESGPETTAMDFTVDDEKLTLQRNTGEALDELHARMRDFVTERTGARYAVALGEEVCRL